MKLKIAVIPFKLSLWLKTVNNLSVLNDPYQMLSVLSPNDLFLYYLSNAHISKPVDKDTFVGAVSEMLCKKNELGPIECVSNAFSSEAWVRFLTEYNDALSDYKLSYDGQYEKLLLGADSSEKSLFYSYRIERIDSDFIAICIDETTVAETSRVLPLLSDKVLTELYKTSLYPFDDAAVRNAVNHIRGIWLKAQCH